jgi:hypothetical protein
MENGKPTEEEVKKDSFWLSIAGGVILQFLPQALLIRPIFRLMRATEYFAWSTCFAVKDTKDKSIALVFLQLIYVYLSIFWSYDVDINANWRAPESRTIEAYVDFLTDQRVI